MIQNEKYWEAVAMAMEAENRKMSVFVRHKYSRGAAREAILRNLLRAQTIAPFQVTTGFIIDSDLERKPSNQIDVLTYDPEVNQPYYAIDEFSVVPHPAAAFGFEVKSKLDKAALRDAVKVKESVRHYDVPVGLFAYGGATFDTFVDYLSEAMKAHGAQSMPECIAVHHKKRNYMGIRPFSWIHEKNHDFRFDAYAALNLPASTKVPKYTATVNMLTIYETYLTELRDGVGIEDSNLNDLEIYSWCESLDLPKEAIVFINPKGEVHHGYPVK